MAGIIPQSNAGALYVGRQPGKGQTPTQFYKLLYTGGSVGGENEYAEQRVLDPDTFSAPIKVSNGVSGGGTFTCLMDPVCAPVLFKSTLSGDTVTADTEDATRSKHVMSTNGAGDGDYLTFIQFTGADGSPLEIGIENRDVKVTGVTPSADPSGQFMSLSVTTQVTEPSRHAETKPSGAIEALKLTAFLYGDMNGELTVGDIEWPADDAGVTQFSLAINRGQTAVKGTNRFAFYAVAPGQSNASLNLNIVLDEASLPFWNLSVYGTETPTAGQLAQSVQLVIPISMVFKRSYKDKDYAFGVDMPNAQITITGGIEPNLDGGVIDIPVTADALKGDNGEAALTITAINYKPTAY